MVALGQETRQGSFSTSGISDKDHVAAAGTGGVVRECRWEERGGDGETGLGL